MTHGVQDRDENRQISWNESMKGYVVWRAIMCFHFRHELPMFPRRRLNQRLFRAGLNCLTDLSSSTGASCPASPFLCPNRFPSHTHMVRNRWFVMCYCKVIPLSGSANIGVMVGRDEIWNRLLLPEDAPPKNPTPMTKQLIMHALYGSGMLSRHSLRCWPSS